MTDLKDWMPSEAERNEAKEAHQESERKTMRVNALGMAAQIHAASGKPAAHILREADQFLAWLEAKPAKGDVCVLRGGNVSVMTTNQPRSESAP